ncbi:uncharacterized protein J7T54_004863 [Emericellopsis cladophorae]|uniref:Vesicular-fusion protein SEC18 n=1 Tax=Emericellopsis cladophorae TaxID=2686198 RepID=A0A9P9Y6D3_9HYPO|nr:uncharacterized protein J7T54_004863 [Emericellopsis cladophorae]KAI6784317.1 hypothetical protein J7T54_004863 [Emericellopsis cladophorae]
MSFMPQRGGPAGPGQPRPGPGGHPGGHPGGGPGQHGSQGGPGGPGRQVTLQCAKVNDKNLQSQLIYSNICAVNPRDFPTQRPNQNFHVLIRGGQPRGEFVVTARPLDVLPPGTISLSDPQRTWCGISLRDQFTGEVYDPFSARDGKAYLSSLDLEVTFASPSKRTDVPFEESDLIADFTKTFDGQVLAPGQRIIMDRGNIPLLVTVKSIILVDLSGGSAPEGAERTREPWSRGILTTNTDVAFRIDSQSPLKLNTSSTRARANPILAPDFKFQDMGIGGLADEFSTIFRRAFLSRIFPQATISKLGISHVKGILMYGPPGTGKTLMARQIGKMLNARPPKVINGPEVLNKYVGQSEENIRKMFADAEKEYKEKGDESGLHIIIFDELDAVCKQRGSGGGGGTGVGDSVVNQLLSKLDGVDKLENILLIGMTNRKDMIDDALLRPGRLEVHLEISLPDEKGRLQILEIHTNPLSKNKMLGGDVNLHEIAEQTKNFSGAELNGLVRSAVSYAMSRSAPMGEQGVPTANPESIMVDRDAFEYALREVRPAYGVSENDLDEAVRRGIIRYSPHVGTTIESMARVIDMVATSQHQFGHSVLFHGPDGSGKTALAAFVAQQSGCPFIKIITPAHLASQRDEFARSDYIRKVFADAAKSPFSIVILDKVEKLIGWNPIGPRFSTTILEPMQALIDQPGSEKHRLLVFATTSNISALKMLEVDRTFRKHTAVPAVGNLRELGAVLTESPVPFSSDDIDTTLGAIERQTGTDRVNVGIKTVLECAFEAQMAPANEMPLMFTELLVGYIE